MKGTKINEEKIYSIGGRVLNFIFCLIVLKKVEI